MGRGKWFAIGAAAGIAVSALGWFMLQSLTTAARQSKSLRFLAEAGLVAERLEEHRRSYGRYPAALDEKVLLGEVNQATEGEIKGLRRLSSECDYYSDGKSYMLVYPPGRSKV